MSRRIAGACIALLLVASVLPVLATDPAPPRLIRVEGWIVDEFCGAKNANADSKACIVECQKKGSALVFVDDEGTVYKMDKQEEALGHIGHRVRIFGKVDREHTLTVGQFVDLEPEAGSEDGADTEVEPGS